MAIRFYQNNGAELLFLKATQVLAQAQAEPVLPGKSPPSGQETGSGRHSLRCRIVSKCALAALQLSPRPVVTHAPLNRIA